MMLHSMSVQVTAWLLILYQTTDRQKIKCCHIHIQDDTLQECIEMITKSCGKILHKSGYTVFHILQSKKKDQNQNVNVL
jgi:hypothetical protein